MTDTFLYYKLVKSLGKKEANIIICFRYNLMRFYNIPVPLAKQARFWTLSHIIQLINTHSKEKVFII
jgi:hypothetical protein